MRARAAISRDDPQLRRSRQNSTLLVADTAHRSALLVHPPLRRKERITTDLVAGSRTPAGTQLDLSRILASAPLGVGHLAAHTSSVATCALSTVPNHPTVVMGERPGGSSSRRYATPAAAGLEHDGAPRLAAPRAGPVVGAGLTPHETEPIGFGVG